MIGGRPPIWDDAEAFDQKVEEYFSKHAQDEVTWSGLARYLGFESRQSLEDYKKRDGFSYPIKKALLRIEEKYEKAMMRQPAGSIFALKNFGWRDKQEIDHTTKGETIKSEIDYSKLSEQALREIASLTEKGKD